MLTERSSLKLDYNFQEVKYDAHINLNDYTYQQASSTLQYQLSERDQVSFSANYSITDYAPILRLYPSVVPLYGYVGGNPAQPFLFATGLGGTDTLTQKINTTGVQASATHSFSETMRGDLSVGYRATNIEAEHSCNGFLGFISPYTGTSCTGSISIPSYPIPITTITFTEKSRGNGYSFSANLEKTFEAAKMTGFASRETNPSGSGLAETDKLGVSLNRNLTEKLTGYFDAIAYRTKYIGVTIPGSRYYTVEPRLNWRLTEWWTLDAGYRYARYEPDSVANAITSNAVYLNVAYTWPKMAVSR